ncbi:hypothetical protein [Escherichia coli]|uniref:hypothetical protein n=1 Tax=Escherichia coli TaxID=562 RepID=UPI001864AC4A
MAHKTKFHNSDTDLAIRLHSGLQFARQPEHLTPAAPAEKTDGAQNQISQF